MKQATRIKRKAKSPASSERRLRLEYISVDDLLEWKSNPRVNDEASERLAGLMKKFGFIDPIIADSEHIIRAGHTRLKAAKRLGMSEVPVIFAPFDSDFDAEMYAISNNVASEWSEWNRPLLRDIMDAAKKANPKLTDKQLSEASGFRQKQISMLRENIKPGVESVLQDYAKNGGGEHVIYLSIPEEQVEAFESMADLLGGVPDGRIAQGSLESLCNIIGIPMESIGVEKQRPTAARTWDPVFSTESCIALIDEYLARGGFPYPSVDPGLARMEINALSILPQEIAGRSELGMRLIEAHHPGLFGATGEASGMVAAFLKAETRRKALQKHFDRYGAATAFDPYLFLDSLARQKGVERKSFMRPAFAMSVYRELAPGSSVLDLSMEYGARMLGAFAANRELEYIGVCPDSRQYQMNRGIVTRHLDSKWRGRLIDLAGKDIRDEMREDAGKIDFAFFDSSARLGTCPYAVTGEILRRGGVALIRVVPSPGNSKLGESDRIAEIMEKMSDAGFQYEGRRGDGYYVSARRVSQDSALTAFDPILIFRKGTPATRTKRAIKRAR